MTRENKVGLAVCGSFLCLVGAVTVLKLHEPPAAVAAAPNSPTLALAGQGAASENRNPHPPVSPPSVSDPAPAEPAANPPPSPANPPAPKPPDDPPVAPPMTPPLTLPPPVGGAPRPPQSAPSRTIPPRPCRPSSVHLRRHRRRRCRIRWPRLRCRPRLAPQWQTRRLRRRSRRPRRRCRTQWPRYCLRRRDRLLPRG